MNGCMFFVPCMNLLRFSVLRCKQDIATKQNVAKKRSVANKNQHKQQSRDTAAQYNEVATTASNSSKYGFFLATFLPDHVWHLGEMFIPHAFISAIIYQLQSCVRRMVKILLLGLVHAWASKKEMISSVCLAPTQMVKTSTNFTSVEFFLR
jgi:hypothetical protein